MYAHAPIDFYFDFSSPYGYFAAEKIDALAEAHGRSVVWHPILLGVAFKHTGLQPLPAVPLKGPYSLHDMARTARYMELPYHQPSLFPIPTQHAATTTRPAPGNLRWLPTGRISSTTATSRIRPWCSTLPPRWA